MRRKREKKQREEKEVKRQRQKEERGQKQKVEKKRSQRAPSLPPVSQSRTLMRSRRRTPMTWWSRFPPRVGRITDTSAAGPSA